MRKTLLVGLLLTSQVAFADPIPNGFYKGQGAWKSAFASGTYGIETTIRSNRISSNYSLIDGWQRHWEFEMNDLNNGFFNIMINKNPVGSGYCLEKVALCHYEIHFNGVRVEETLMMHEGNLHKFGSKKTEVEHLFWQESLEKNNIVATKDN